MASWKIGSRGGACARCEGVFADGERHVSTLVFNAEGELWREDLCARCWKAPEPGAQVADEPHSLFWWFTRHRVDKKKTLQLDLAALEQIFVSLEGREEEPVRELRYLLCLILMRKRRVKLEKLERGPAGESFLVKRPRRDQRYRVFVFDFSPERLDELRAQLQALFDGADLEDGVNLPQGEAQDVDAEGAQGAEPGPTEPRDGLSEADDLDAGPPSAPAASRRSVPSA